MPNQRKIQLEEANEILSAVADELSTQDWFTNAVKTWPSPIAFEVQMLHNLMKDHESPDSVLIQVRDVYEVTTKFIAAILSAAIVQTSPGSRNDVNRQIFVPNKGLGTWVANLVWIEAWNHDGLQLPEWAERLRGSLAEGVRLGLGDFVQFRNDLIGHAAKALDPRDTAKFIKAVLFEGHYAASGIQKNFQHLSKVFTELAESRVLEEVELSAYVSEENISLKGASAMLSWLNDDSHAQEHHGEEDAQLYLVHGGARTTLSPYVSGRICKKCTNRDIFFFDSIRDKRGSGTFDLLDYARGHKLRTKGNTAKDLAEAIANIDNMMTNDVGQLSLNAAETLKALDSARIDRNYKSPTYLRNAFRDFFEENTSGIFWLRAPAHTGKTTFIQGLSEGELREKPLSKKKQAFVISFYCRKEHRPTKTSFLSTLSQHMANRFGVSTLLSDDTVAPQIVGKRGTSEAFLEWLHSWRNQLMAARMLMQDQALVFAVDGLDEAPDPTNSNESLLDFLPSPEQLPDNVFLLLTSRIPGQPETPTFLAEKIAPLYEAL